MVAAPAAMAQAGPWGAVVLIARDPVLGGHLGRDHLQQVELRGNLEQRTCQLGRQVQAADIGSDVADLQRARQRPGSQRPGPQGLQRDQFEVAGGVAPVVGERDQLQAFDGEALAGSAVASLREAGQTLKPVHTMSCSKSIAAHHNRFLT